MTRTVLTVGLLVIWAAVSSAQIFPKRELTSNTTATITTNGGEVCFGTDNTIPSVVLSISGTWTGTIAPRFKDAAGTVKTPASGIASATSTTVNADISVGNLGYAWICAVATASMTGTATVRAVAGGTGGVGGGGGSGGSVTQGTDPWVVAGHLSNNGAAPSTTNVGVLPAVATAAAPSFTEGRLGALSMDLSGALRVSGGGGGTQYTQDAALTVGTSVGTMAMGRASATAPTDVSAANDAVMPWYLLSGASVQAPSFGGVLAVAGNGASGTGVQRVTLANDSTGVVGLATGSNTIGALTANQSVNVAQINGVTTLMGNGASGTGAQRVTLANDSTGILASVTTVGTVTTITNNVNTIGTLANDGAAAGTNRVATLPGLVETSAPTRTNGRNAGFSFLAGGGARVVIVNDAGASSTLAQDSTFDAAVLTTGPAVQFRAETTTPSAVSDGDAVYPMATVSGQAFTVPGADANPIGAASECNLITTASTNATNCKNAAGNLYGYEFINTTATLAYVRLYNLSSAPTCSSATGFIRSIPVPASATGAGVTRSSGPIYVAYGTGIGFCATGGGSSTDNTNAVAGVYLNLLYK